MNFSPRQFLLVVGTALLVTGQAQAHVTIDYPNGGNVFVPGQTITLEWHINIQHNLQNWDIFYSTTGNPGPLACSNDGTWLPLAMNVEAGSTSVGVPHYYDWVIPNTPSNMVRFRIRMDNSATDYCDLNNGNETILGGPGLASCFGMGCPCGNDDSSAGCANSTGSGALLIGSGTTSVLADDLLLSASGVPAFNSGLYYMGNTQIAAPFYDGMQCALGTTLRFLCCIQNSGAGGTMVLGPGIASNASGLITAGTTWYFHAWHRDASPGPGPCGTGANLTNLYGVTFSP